MSNYWGEEDESEPLELNGDGGSDRDDYPEYPPGYQDYLRKQYRADGFSFGSALFLMMGLGAILATFGYIQMFETAPLEWWGVPSLWIGGIAAVVFLIISVVFNSLSFETRNS